MFENRGGMTNLYRLADQKARRRIVSFDKRELSRLLGLYSMRVASGEWRDYAIDFRPGMAIFSIFRHTAEQPLFAIAKVPGGGTGGRAITWSTTAPANWRTATRSKTYCASSSVSSNFCWDSATSSVWWPRRCRRPPLYRPAWAPPGANLQPRRPPGRRRHRCHHRSRRVHPVVSPQAETDRASGRTRRETEAVFIFRTSNKRGERQVSAVRNQFFLGRLRPYGPTLSRFLSMCQLGVVSN